MVLAIPSKTKYLIVLVSVVATVEILAKQEYELSNWMHGINLVHFGKISTKKIFENNHEPSSLVSDVSLDVSRDDLEEVILKDSSSILESEDSHPHHPHHSPRYIKFLRDSNSEKVSWSQDHRKLDVMYDQEKNVDLKGLQCVKVHQCHMDSKDHFIRGPSFTRAIIQQAKSTSDHLHIDFSKSLHRSLQIERKMIMDGLMFGKTFITKQFKDMTDAQSQGYILGTRSAKTYSCSLKSSSLFLTSNFIHAVEKLNHGLYRDAFYHQKQHPDSDSDSFYHNPDSDTSSSSSSSIDYSRRRKLLTLDENDFIEFISNYGTHFMGDFTLGAAQSNLLVFTKNASKSTIDEVKKEMDSQMSSKFCPFENLKTLPNLKNRIISTSCSKTTRPLCSQAVHSPSIIGFNHLISLSTLFSQIQGIDKSLGTLFDQQVAQYAKTKVEKSMSCLLGCKALEDVCLGNGNCVRKSSDVQGFDVTMYKWNQQLPNIGDHYGNPSSQVYKVPLTSFGADTNIASTSSTDMLCDMLCDADETTDGQLKSFTFPACKNRCHDILLQNEPKRHLQTFFEKNDHQHHHQRNLLIGNTNTYNGNTNNGNLGIKKNPTVITTPCEQDFDYSNQENIQICQFIHGNFFFNPEAYNIALRLQGFIVAPLKGSFGIQFECRGTCHIMIGYDQHSNLVKMESVEEEFILPSNRKRSIKYHRQDAKKLYFFELEKGRNSVEILYMNQGTIMPRLSIQPEDQRLQIVQIPTYTEYHPSG